jgi:circadian clock protein KaiC
MHLVHIHKQVKEFDPRVVIFDPITNFTAAGSAAQAEAMLVRLIDFLKMRGVTAMLVSLMPAAGEANGTGISSLIDTWVLLHHIEVGAEHRRALHVRKSRGMQHSNQVREFRLTAKGVTLVGAPPRGKRPKDK